MYTFDFRKTAEALRELIRETDDINRKELWKAVEGVEQELAVQSVLFLYEHLVQFEQWTAAAHLVSFALPTVVRRDPRLYATFKHAASIADKLTNPEAEALFLHSREVQKHDSDFLRNMQCFSHRGWWWLRAVRLQGAKRVLEYGTGGGANVIHAAQADPFVEWWGLDFDLRQVECNAQAAGRVGAACRFTGPDEKLHGTFDHVALLDILEHSAFPVDILTDAEKYLRPGGYVSISVPCGPWSLHTTNYATINDHINVATLGGLKQLCASRGAILAEDVEPGPSPFEGNRSAFVTYQPGGRREPLAQHGKIANAAERLAAQTHLDLARGDGVAVVIGEELAGDVTGTVSYGEYRRQHAGRPITAVLVHGAPMGEILPKLAVLKSSFTKDCPVLVLHFNHVPYGLVESVPALLGRAYQHLTGGLYLFAPPKEEKEAP